MRKLLADCWRQLGRQIEVRDAIARLACRLRLEPIEIARARLLVSGTEAAGRVPMPNVWLAVSVENQATADERIPILQQTPAAVRFLSVEPLLGYVDLHAYLSGILRQDGKIGWVIVGGESGPEARECSVDWIRTVVAHCRGANVPVFVKQLGSNPDFGFNELQVRRANPIFDRHGGDPAEWPEDLRIREFPR